MKQNIVCLSAAAAALLAVSSPAALVAGSGYTAQSIYSTAGTFTTLGGLDVFNGRIYTGQFTDILSMNTDGSAMVTEGTVPSNAGNSFVSVRSDGRISTAFTTSYTPPAPSVIGYMNAGGLVSQMTSLDGVYDAARDGAGNLYLSANDDGAGNRIYRYDEIAGLATEVANIGGVSGGLAFDSSGNLYYSAYDAGKVVSFSAAQIGGVLSGAAVLSLADAVSEIALANPGSLAFDSNDQLYASYLDSSWNTVIVALNPDGSTVDVAAGGGKMVVDGDTIYTIDTDWYAYSSEIYAVKAIPEPGTVTLMLMSGAGLLAFRKRRTHFIR